MDRAANSATITALAAGIYVSTFHIVSNITMLSTASILLVTVAMTASIVVVVSASNVILLAFKLESYADFIAMLICGLFLAMALRAPVFEHALIQDIRGQLQGVTRLVAHAIYLAVPATLIAFIFRKNVGKLTIVLLAMTIAAVLLGFRGASGNIPANDADRGLMNINLRKKPNIYLILADSFASFSYMNENEIDVSEFKGKLSRSGFRFYDDTFANYHSTTASMLSMLDMRHHYYVSTRKFSEVSRSSREVIGGENNLMRMLKRNGYQTQYVHQGEYLLLQGCTVDYCYPAPSSFSGARKIFRRILPNFLIPPRLASWKWETQSFDRIKAETINLIIAGNDSSSPKFRYVHIYEPGHAGNDVVGNCDEAVELEKYSHNVADATEDILGLVDEIILLDPSAVIVVSGDHGPFISNQCERKADLHTPAEYRDRVSAITAIRWPKDYDGRYDRNIKTNVNLFRFLLASLTEDSSEIISSVVADDVYAQGNLDILKIIGDGNVMIPPERYTPAELKDFYLQESNR